MMGLWLFPFVGLLVGVTIAYGCARLRLPVEPLLLLMLGNVLVHILPKRLL